MSKLSVAQAAEKFKVSKEAIHNRIRRGSLDCVIEHGMKYVLLDEPKEAQVVHEPVNDKYHSYIEDENRLLKEKIKDLEQQNLTLRDHKEQMLIEEKKKIEQIYKERDEQLKQVLHTISSKFLSQMPVKDPIIEDAHYEVNDIIDIQEPISRDEPMRLKEFLKLKEYKPAKHQRVKNRFKRLLGQDKRIFKHKGKICIDPTKYDYKDLIKD